MGSKTWPIRQEKIVPILTNQTLEANCNLNRRKAKKGAKMRLKVFAIRDTKAEVYNTPFYQQSHGEAERNFQTLVNDNKSTVSQYPEDFDLYFLGEYDDNLGTFFTEPPKHVIKAVQLKTAQKSSNVTAMQ